MKREMEINKRRMGIVVVHGCHEGVRMTDANGEQWMSKSGGSSRMKVRNLWAYVKRELLRGLEREYSVKLRFRV